MAETEVEMKTLMCPGPPEHTFYIPKGRGRPPRYCDVHDPKKNPSNTSEQKENKSEPKRPAPGTRPAPPGKKAPRVAPPVASELDKPIAKENQSGEATMDESGKITRKSPPLGKSDAHSRAKAENAANQNARQAPDTDQSWPRNSVGRPMAKIEFSASELVPTGQYANVSVGPCRITTFVDLDIENFEEGVFTKRELQVLAQAANELAETVEANVVAVQRALVYESLQEQMSNGNS